MTSSSQYFDNEDYLYTLIAQEQTFPALKYTLDNQITEYMREQLIDWIIEHFNDLNCFSTRGKQMVFFYIDYFLKNHNIHPSYLQLLGVTAILLSSKFEETFLYTVEMVIAISGNQYTVKEVQQMEMQIIKNLDWKLNVCTPIDFLEYYIYTFYPDFKSQEANMDQVYLLMNYTNTKFKYVGSRQSSIALGILFFYFSKYDMNKEFTKIEEIVLQQDYYNHDEILQIYDDLNNDYMQYYLQESNQINNLDQYIESEGVQNWNINNEEHNDNNNNLQNLEEEKNEKLNSKQKQINCPQQQQQFQNQIQLVNNSKNSIINVGYSKQLLYQNSDKQKNKSISDDSTNCHSTHNFNSSIDNLELLENMNNYYNIQLIQKNTPKAKISDQQMEEFKNFRSQIQFEENIEDDLACHYEEL